jgi:hypothetical protein
MGLCFLVRIESLNLPLLVLLPCVHLRIYPLGNTIPFNDNNDAALSHQHNLSHNLRTVAKNLKREFDYGRHPDGSGWLVKRVG